MKKSRLFKKYTALTPLAGCMLLLCLLAGVPKARGEFRWGPTAGLTLTNLDFKQKLFAVDRSLGPQLGVGAEMMFPGIGFGVDMGAYYSQEGATLHLGDRLIWASQGFGTQRTYLHYLQIPFNLKFKWTRMNGFEDKLAPYVFGGPVFSILLAHSHQPAVEFSNGYVGLQCGAGVEIARRWQVQASYQWGMTYALRMALLTNDSARSKGWSLRVTYLF